MNTPIAKMIAEMHDKGIPVELIVSAVATFEEAMAARAVSTGNTVDTSTIDKRRAWDRERKRRKRASALSTGLPPDSAGIPPDGSSIISSKEKESSKEEVEEKKESKKRDARGTRIPPDFSIDDADRKFAASLGIPPDTVEAETPQFIDYWSGIPGHRGLKTNWKATWRNRMRDLKKYLPSAQVRAMPSRSMTEFQRGRNETKGILDDLEHFAAGGGNGGQENTRLLSGNPGERSQGLRSGAGGDVIDLPSSGGRSRV